MSSDAHVEHTKPRISQAPSVLAKRQKPRKGLGVLEATALFLVSARAVENIDTTAPDLFAEFAHIDGRSVSVSGIYLLLDALERKGLLAQDTRLTVDAVGRPRPVRYYRMTDLGMTTAASEYRAQSSILELARFAFSDPSQEETRSRDVVSREAAPVGDECSRWPLEVASKKDRSGAISSGPVGLNDSASLNR